jgi:hypothetical protein
MSITSFSLFPYLINVGRPVAFAVTVYFSVKAAILVTASTVAMHTEDDKRREACLELARIVSRGWPRLPGG